MVERPLVSIVTPCFNAEATLGRLLDSVLAQTYPNIELILVDDGSTDFTHEVVELYRARLTAGLSAFTYIRQENRGVSAAINTGLKRVRGRYLCWPDADDYFEPESVELRASILEKKSDYAVVTSDAYLRSADQATSARRVSTDFVHTRDEWQFYHLLRSESMFTSGSHMACMRRFDTTHPGRVIYPARRGQNWQMLLPLYYRYKRYFLDVPLFNVMEEAGSLSRSDDSLDKKLRGALDHQDILLKTLSNMDMKGEDRILSECIVAEIYARAVMRAGIEFRDRRTLVSGYRLLAEVDGVEPLDSVRALLASLGILGYVRALRKLRHMRQDSGLGGERDSGNE